VQILREWMSSRADAFVAVGGKGWSEAGTDPEVPEELRLALARYLPCFILGGLGGALREYLDPHPDVIHALRNGLGYESNRDLALTGDVTKLATEVVNQLGCLPLVRGSGLLQRSIAHVRANKAGARCRDPEGKAAPGRFT
jgi:hypothetical protein